MTSILECRVLGFLLCRALCSVLRPLPSKISDLCLPASGITPSWVLDPCRRICKWLQRKREGLCGFYLLCFFCLMNSSLLYTFFTFSIPLHNFILSHFNNSFTKKVILIPNILSYLNYRKEIVCF